MRHTLAFLTLVPALCAGCAGQAAQTVPLALAPCAVPGIGTPDSVWHQVRASGFTFCVPPGWQPSRHSTDSVDAKRWHGNGASVTWDLGRPPSPAQDGVIEGRVEIVSGPGTRMPARMPPPKPGLPPTPCAPLRMNTIPLMIDGVSLLVTRVECPPTWTTTAWSTTPPMYVRGEAHSGTDAELLLRVIPTLRFTSSAR